jgi:hypothetical protein
MMALFRITRLFCSPSQTATPLLVTQNTPDRTMLSCALCMLQPNTRHVTSNLHPIALLRLLWGLPLNYPSTGL